MKIKVSPVSRCTGGKFGRSSRGVGRNNRSLCQDTRSAGQSRSLIEISRRSWRSVTPTGGTLRPRPCGEDLFTRYIKRLGWRRQVSPYQIAGGHQKGYSTYSAPPPASPSVLSRKSISTPPPAPPRLPVDPVADVVVKPKDVTPHGLRTRCQTACAQRSRSSLVTVVRNPAAGIFLRCVELKCAEGKHTLWCALSARALSSERERENIYVISSLAGVALKVAAVARSSYDAILTAASLMGVMFSLHIVISTSFNRRDIALFLFHLCCAVYNKHYN